MREKKDKLPTWHESKIAFSLEIPKVMLSGETEVIRKFVQMHYRIWKLEKENADLQKEIRKMKKNRVGLT